MRSGNRFLPHLVFVIIFVACDAQGTGANTGRPTATTKGTPPVTGRSTRGSPSGTTTARALAASRRKLTNDILFPLPENNNKQVNGGNPANRIESIRTFPPSTTDDGKSSATEAACTDTASVKSCFDYFTLALIWPPGDAKKYSDVRNRRITAKWSIHGLWPSMYSKNATIPTKCKVSTSYISKARMETGKILDKLHASWYTVLENKRGESRSQNFWEHEFNKHGKCAIRSPALKNDLDYFSKTLDLYESLQLGVILSNQIYRPGAQIPLRKIVTIIEDKINVKPVVKYVTKDSNNYLSEVYICLNTTLTGAINCPNAFRTTQVLDKNITYPSI